MASDRDWMVVPAPGERKRRRAAHGDERVAVAYLRVSTEEQHLSPEAQRAAIEKWAGDRGVAVVAWHSDVGVSGALRLDKRLGLLAAVEDVRVRRAGWFVVSRRDRLARDVVVCGLAERLVEQVGARVVTADGVANGEGPDQAFMRLIMDAVSQYERALIGMRTSAALRAKRARGELAGRVPYGFRATPRVDVPDGERRPPRLLSKDPAEWANVERARELHRNGLSLRRIAATLDAEGRRPRDGSRWVLSTISKIVREAV